MTALVTTRSYPTVEAARLARATYRQVDRWARFGVARPSVLDAAGYGSARRWSTDDVGLLVLARLLSDSAGGGPAAMPLERLAGILDAVRPQVPGDGILVVGATSTTVVAGLDEVVLDGATVLVSLEQVHEELASAGAVSSSPTRPQGAAQAHVTGGGEAGPARVTAEQTGPVRGAGSTREGADAPTPPPAEASSRLLALNATPPTCLEHAGGIRTSA